MKIHNAVPLRIPLEYTSPFRIFSVFRQGYLLPVHTDIFTEQLHPDNITAQQHAGKRNAAVKCFRVRISPVLEQQPDDFPMAEQCRLVQCETSRSIRFVRVDSRFQKPPDLGQVPRFRRVDQSGSAGGNAEVLRRGRACLRRRAGRSGPGRYPEIRSRFGRSGPGRYPNIRRRVPPFSVSSPPPSTDPRRVHCGRF